ncbi:hypothetical protein [Nonomuraea zeae]|uniref:Uncharacterized protein n=1 Tax=Nonomuraea zeae TaxID=1642303 RepID=A0A5S4GGP0_9ACTN|nr:hypothetical protein [Nonomuraea zeae]TMR32147.1 hypothetical protein ETD85_23555 [Nonomuraea zeae]
MASVLVPCTVALFAVACSAPPPAVPERPGATSSAPSTAAGPSSSGPEEPPSSDLTMTMPPPTLTGPLRVPGMDAGTKTLLKAGPRRGSMIVGDIPPGRSGLWIIFFCRGAGTAEIRLEPGYILPFTCQDGVIAPIMNRMDAPHEKTLTVRIQAPTAVEWALRITR